MGFRGKKLEGEHGVWFGGEWEEREWFIWLISLIWQDKGIKEAVLGKMWANPLEALPSGASTACDKGVASTVSWEFEMTAQGPLRKNSLMWSTGEPRSTACDKGVASTVSWEFELTAQGPLRKNSLMWSTGEPRSTACDKGVGERCQLRIWVFFS